MKQSLEPLTPDPLTALSAEVVSCTACPRLTSYCRSVAETKVRRYQNEEYWGRPVPGFGDSEAALVIVGLAPAAHGANRTGQMFTGDDSGNWLYEALFRYRFANQPTAKHRDDGLRLTGAYITAAARCAPPDNKPARAELETCRLFLVRELQLLRGARVVVTLGRIALDSYLQALRSLGYSPWRPTFGHNLRYRSPVAHLPWLITSYHPSRQNTQTGRLTRDMWYSVFAQARELVDVTERTGVCYNGQA